MRPNRRHFVELGLLVGAALLARAGHAGVLPEDRADILWHNYDGGGVTIDGPSLLVRKSIGESVSVSGSYYKDMVSSASIDVVTTASPYKEERTQWGVGVDYLRGDTTMSLGVSSSDENDYSADTLNFGISQEVFGGLTTISIGYGKGSDDVSRRASTFADNVDRHAYRLGVSQVVTRNLILGFSYEAIADEGFLNNPYRRVRYLDAGAPPDLGYSFQDEVYPRTRASNSVAIRGKYYLPFRAALSAEYRFFNDDWGISAHTGEFGLTVPWDEGWLFDARVRYYTQNEADFYADLFPFANAQNFLARDKELSAFNNVSLRLGATYTLYKSPDSDGRMTLNAFVDGLWFTYDNFRDLRDVDADPGSEPLYDFSATVTQLFFSWWF